MKRSKLILMLTAMTVLSFAYIGFKHYNSTPPSLIRLHVIANSNTFYDQQLKYQVKDRIVLETRDEFSSARNINEARKIADQYSKTIELAALDEIKKQGFNYPVRVVRGNFQFPEKTYTIQKETGEVTQLTLPPGKYEAVRVVIGEGKGANWWCVLYPPLCFVDLAKTAPSASLAAASAVEKQDQTHYSHTNKPRVEYQFKAVEIFKSIFRK